MSEQGGNWYDPHPGMIDSGEFWRCDHGVTRFMDECWACGMARPRAFARLLWREARRRLGKWVAGS